MSTINSILKIDSNEIELLIHDTSDTNDLESYLSTHFDDKRLNYTYTSPPVTFSETFNKAVMLSKGEYVCVIGDDDGVNPEIVEATHWAKELKIDAITPSLIAVYGWPDLRHRYYGSGDAGKLKIKGFTSGILYPDVEKELENCVTKAFQDFGNLPKIYYGIVRRRCLDELYMQSGSFFFGSSPDISGALAVASYVKRLCVVDYPLFLPGSSANSGAGRSGMKKHVGRLEDVPQTRPFLSSWPKIIPSFYSVQTVWAQSGIEALCATKRHDLLAKFDIPLLHAMCLMHNPSFYRVIIKNLFDSLRPEGVWMILGISRFFLLILKNLVFRARGPIYRVLKVGYYKYNYILPNINSIEEAVDRLSIYLKSINRHFGDIQISK